MSIQASNGRSSPIMAIGFDETKNTSKSNVHSVYTVYLASYSKIMELSKEYQLYVEKQKYQNCAPFLHMPDLYNISTPTMIGNARHALERTQREVPSNNATRFPLTGYRADKICDTVCPAFHVSCLGLLTRTAYRYRGTRLRKMCLSMARPRQSSISPSSADEAGGRDTSVSPTARRRCLP